MRREGRIWKEAHRGGKIMFRRPITVARASRSQGSLLSEAVDELPYESHLYHYNPSTTPWGIYETSIAYH